MEFSSLFCTQGKDNPQRFLALQLLTLLGLGLSWVVFAGTPLLWLVGILLVAIITLSAYRRTLDSKKGLVAALISMLVNTSLFVVVASQSGLISFIFTLLLVIVSTVVLIRAPSKSRGKFVYGYCGPKALVSVMSTPRQRIEPTLGGNVAADFSRVHPQLESQQYEPTNEEQADFRQNLHELKTQLQKLPLKLIGMSLAGLILLVISIGVVDNLINSEGTYQTPEDVHALAQVEQMITSDVSLDDGLDLHLLVSNNQFFVSWYGEATTTGPIWQLATANGDPSCSELNFNTNSKFRPLVVEVLANGKTRASFSPLDTKAILSQLAKRNQVAICGYKFSLKGSTNAMSMNDDFFLIMD